MIFNYFGKTESGKSYLGNIHSKKYDRAVIYDNAHCFTDGRIISDLSIGNLKKLLVEYSKNKKFRLIFRAPRTMSEKQGANRVASFVQNLGEFYKSQGQKERFLFLVDEADKVSTMSKENAFYRAVTKGRHYNYDCFGISQGVAELPIYWRKNASASFVFRLPDGDDVRKLLGKSASSQLKDLAQYSYMLAKDNAHEVQVIDRNQKVIRSIKN